MAARKQLWHPDAVREKIRASQLVNRLQDHVNGAVELSSTQVQAALGLLKKCVPDLQATQHSGDANNPIIHSIERRIVRPSDTGSGSI